MIVIIDNYDSFTYNLVQLIREIKGEEPKILRNDEIDDDVIKEATYLILSPGPGVPAEAGELLQVIRSNVGRIPILGVCLGHQAIGEVYGANLRNLSKVFHGKKMETKLTHDVSPLFTGLPSSFEVGRYHSWVIDHGNFPAELVITAVDESGEIMALQHKTMPVYGVQFHPESIMTAYGKEIMRNFLNVKMS
ncbi:MAG TPA: aminodeoxychorismate/anthranilate synthase component II [Saprospiraceae bacterium]|nr:aminodeoxychorismate/anthranilate synthase component II [Saprospiraceae bacterium]